MSAYNSYPPLPSINITTINSIILNICNIMYFRYPIPKHSLVGNLVACSVSSDMHYLSGLNSRKIIVLRISTIIF